MNVGVPGMSDREFYFSMAIVVLCVLGALGNYLYHKVTGKGLQTLTVGSGIRAIVLGGIAGLILVVLTQGGANIGHYDIIIPALAWGASCEAIVGKYLGWRETKSDGVCVMSKRKRR